MSFFEEDLVSKEHFKAVTDQASKELKEIRTSLSLKLGVDLVKGGLTPDCIKNKQEFKLAKYKFNVAFERERKFNQLFLRKYKKEYRAYVIQQRQEKLLKREKAQMVEV